MGRKGQEIHIRIWGALGEHVQGGRAGGQGGQRGRGGGQGEEGWGEGRVVFGIGGEVGGCGGLGGLAGWLFLEGQDVQCYYSFIRPNICRFIEIIYALTWINSSGNDWGH